MLCSLLPSRFLTWKTFCVSSRWLSSHPQKKMGCCTPCSADWRQPVPLESHKTIGRTWSWPVQGFLYGATMEVTFSSFPAAFHRAKLWTSRRNWLLWGRWKAWLSVRLSFTWLLCQMFDILQKFPCQINATELKSLAQGKEQKVKNPNNLPVAIRHLS